MVTTAPLEPSPALEQPNGGAQSAGFLLELSPDWLILRASENVHGFLGEYPARLIGEPLSEFTLAQPLHDLRNSLARQRSSNGIARAYRSRLTDEPRYFDIAFQQVDGRILLEGLPSGTAGFGDSLGAVSRIIDGMIGATRAELLENAARRLRALTGFDRVTFWVTEGGEDLRAESARAPFAAPASDHTLPALVADAESEPVGVFPTARSDSMVGQALLRALSSDDREELRASGVRSVISVPMARQGREIGRVRCDRLSPCAPSLELHAAAELFAQIVAIELERL